MRKEELRCLMRQTKRQFSPQQLGELSLPVVERLRQRLGRPPVVLAYYPLPDEVDIRPLLDELLAAGTLVLLPKVTGEHTMVWQRYCGSDQLQAGAFSIMEPAGGQVYAMPACQTDALILVPGVAFDGCGRRLGRGKGYYDRFLASCPHIYKIGVCFGFQRVAEVPAGALDIAVDEVVS